MSSLKEQQNRINIAKELKEDIIDDYRTWVETAFLQMEDTLSLQELSIEAFERKINELIKICKE